MNHERPSPAPGLARFGSPLARVMFIEPDVQGAVRARPAELKLARAVAIKIDQASHEQLHVLAQHLQARVLPCLSAEAMVEVACAIERKAPWMFEQIPGLVAHQRRLRRAADMSAVFSLEHLTRLGDALRKEASRS